MRGLSIPANEDEPERLTITDAHLAGYLRGDLDEADRRKVEGYLACNPDVAARVMADLHRGAGRPAAKRRRPARALGVLALAAVGACLLSGWAGSWVSAELSARWRESDGDAAPAYVEDAAESQQATMVRLAMASQSEETKLDPSEIRKAMRIELPVLPSNWRVLDVQVYPSDDGPGVSLWLQTPTGQRFSLFAVSADTAAGRTPQIASDGRRKAAFWENGRSAFVLLGDGSVHDLVGSARVLSGNTTL
jgi:hypothetical protein